MTEDGYMIKCEGCGQLLRKDIFYKHASHSKKCKEAYGSRLEAMKKEKRQEVRFHSYQKNKEKSIPGVKMSPQNKSAILVRLNS